MNTPLVSRHEVTVEWGDCDPAGIVYYPAYFRWSDQATYRLFLSAGLKRDDVSSGQWKEGTPLVAAECAFKRASQHGEKLTVMSRVERFGRSSFTIRHVFYNEDGEIAAEGTETRIWAKKDGDARSLKAVAIPDDVKRRLGGEGTRQEVTLRENWYHCYQDEKHFFSWLESIPAVENVKGGPQGLTIRIAEKGLDRDDWADLLGLLGRYGIDMRPLQALVTPEHEAWLKDPEKYWHASMWGG